MHEPATNILLLQCWLYDCVSRLCGEVPVSQHGVVYLTVVDLWRWQWLWRLVRRTIMPWVINVLLHVFTARRYASALSSSSSSWKLIRHPLQGLSGTVQYNVSQLQTKTNSNMLKTSKSYYEMRLKKCVVSFLQKLVRDEISFMSDGHHVEQI